MSILQTTNYPNALLQNTFKNQFFQNVVNPAKLGTGPKPSLGTLIKNWSPLKAFSPKMLATGPTKGGLIGAVTLAGLGGAYFGDWAYKNWEPATKFGDWTGGGIYDYINQTKFKQQQLMNIKKQKIKQKIRDAAAAAKATSSFDPSGPTQASIRRDRADKSGRGHSGGFTNPGKGSYGPHKADGGLINFYRYGGFSG